ncbi:MAG TPA: hypothetical protein VJ723_08620 [Candidatus Angelobacter sp.]|nr:hypothetical protein [Candidatus Angelobacter sp.]
MTTRSKTLLAEWLILIATLSVAPPACASLKDIQQPKLPQNPAIMKAIADVSAVEDMVWQWNEKWPFAVPKKKIVAALSASLAELKKQTDLAPDNVELLLLTALVARYAHNVDVPEAGQPLSICWEKFTNLRRMNTATAGSWVCFNARPTR